jgi:hypothetical protein
MAVRLDGWTDAQVTAALSGWGLVTGGGRATEQARLSAACDAQVVLMQTQGTALISQVPFAPTGVPIEAIQNEVQQRYNALGIIG